MKQRDITYVFVAPYRKYRFPGPLARETIFSSDAQDLTSFMSNSPRMLEFSSTCRKLFHLSSLRSPSLHEMEKDFRVKTVGTFTNCFNSDSFKFNEWWLTLVKIFLKNFLIQLSIFTDISDLTLPKKCLLFEGTVWVGRRVSFWILLKS